jgi:WD40 repeat protein
MAEQAEATSQADQARDGQRVTQAPDGAGAASGPDGHATGEATAAATTTPSGNGAGAPEAAQHDLFLSYAEADREWVEGYLSNALTHAGVRFTSEATFALGVPRIQAFEQAVQQSRRTLLVLSPAYLADGFSDFVNLLAQTYGLESATWPVIPLIMQPVALPPRLAMLTRLDASDPARWDEVVERLCIEAQRPAPAPAPPPSCPYPGMVPFAEADSARFFGREEMVADLLQRLRLHSFLAVIGPSGSGKSSLVYAGLLPALRKSTLFGLGDWRVCTLRPGASPLAALHTALDSDPAAPAQAVTAALAGQAEARRLLVVVDQLEELFTLGAQEATPFAQALLALADTPSCFVLLTVRADFYPDLMTSPLWGRVQAHRAEVVPLSSDGLRQAIVRPAEDAGVFVETALVERLLADAANEPGVLPLVQETLVLLWEHLERRYLPLRAYEALVLPRAAYGADVVGTRTGLQVAMARRADAALADLSPTQQAIARRIFLRLVQFGEGRADTRRQQPLDELRAAGDEAAAFDQTLSHLVNCRLLTLSGGDGGSERMVDIAHEALIGGWPALQEWIQARRAAELTRRRLEEKAVDWVRLGRGRGGLLDDVELAEAESWLASPDAQELGYDAALAELAQASRAAIEAAAQAQEAARQRELEQAQALAAEQQRVAEEQRKRAEEQAQAAARLRQRAVALAGVLLLACVAAVVALSQWRTASNETVQARKAQATAVRSKDLAQQAADKSATQVVINHNQALDALSRQLAVQGLSLLGSQYDTALLLSVEANHVAHTPDARDSVLQAVEYSPHIVTFLRGHKDIVASVAFSRDGRTLASGSYDGTIRLWDVVTHQQIGAITVAKGAVDSVAFSPNGHSLVSGDADGTIRVWDVATRRQMGAPLTGHTSYVSSVAFSPDGGKLASGSGSPDGTIRLWNMVTHKQIGRAISNFADPVNAVAFNPNGSVLASAGNGDDVRLWSVATHLQVGAEIFTSTGPAYSLAFSPDGGVLASGGLDASIRLWNVATQQQLGAPLTGHTGPVYSVAFSPDGRTLASGSEDSTIRVWDVATHGQVGAPFTGHSGTVLSVAFSPNGHTLASGSADHTVGLWDLGTQRQVGAVFTTANTDQVFSVAFSRDNRILASGSYYGFIRLWGVVSHRQIGPTLHCSNSVYSLAFRPDGRVLASVCAAGSGVQFWNTTTHRQIGAPLDAYIVAFSPDRRVLALVGPDGAIRLWNAVTRTPLHVLPTRDTGGLSSLTFSPDGRTLASGSADGTVRLWDMTTYRQIGLFSNGMGGGQNVAFSPDGRTFATSSGDHNIRLWDLLTHSQIGDPLTGHSSYVRTMAFSPDGRTLASGSDDYTIRLWDVETHRQIGDPLTGHSGAVYSVAFSPDGRTLASGSADGTVRLWNARYILDTGIEEWERQVCSITNRNLTMAEWQNYVGAGIPYERTCPGLPAGDGAPSSSQPAKSTH